MARTYDSAVCGIFGATSSTHSCHKDFLALARFSRQRGSDASGAIVYRSGLYDTFYENQPVTNLLKDVALRSPKDEPSVLLGHSRLITDDASASQPLWVNGIAVGHNGIIVNHEEVLRQLNRVPQSRLDSEVVGHIVEDFIRRSNNLDELPNEILNHCQGAISAFIALPSLGKLLLISNTGSLFVARDGDRSLFASEKAALTGLTPSEPLQIVGHTFIDIPQGTRGSTRYATRKLGFAMPALQANSSLESLLVTPSPDLRRCTRCILPETFPFIKFDDEGVCNYCTNYKPRNSPRPLDELVELLEPYRRRGEPECIIPFSGGRDSSYALHFAVRELGMRPITYTYDWGMITDLGRRNISRMTAALGVENIVVASDIAKKRRNIRMNLSAWLRDPDLGLLSLLTAGDKHFFKYIRNVQQSTGVSLNLWGINPLETTHFKTGFLGIPPNFLNQSVYSKGWQSQLQFHSRRFKRMVPNSGYFNRSLIDTLSGEYYRSFRKQQDYFHLFDFWKWDEKDVETTLDTYDWERAPDTNATWRIGDGTAAFYNYVYYLCAGFSEHDTFRSNQIREGDITRSQALTLVQAENKPRYENINWYLDAVGIDYSYAIEVVNQIRRLHPSLYT